MMPSSTSADKSRQTSAGKSFFGRKLHKERPEIRHHYESGSASGSGSVYGGSSGGGGDENIPPSAARSPRHTKRSSVQSVDINDPDTTGVAPTAGVITSIPFDSMPSETRTPIAVDYLSKADAPAQRREPSPHHLAKGLGDFHQYPAWNPESVKVNNVYSHPTGPRPPPHASNVTMTGSSSGAMGPRYQQWGRPGSSATGNNVPLSHNSSSTFDSSSNSRFSLDQVSLHSSVSSNTRGSNYFSSSDGSSRTLTTSHSGDRNTLFPSGSSSRLSTATTSTTGPAPVAPDNYLSRPRDDRIVDQLFVDLMQKRGWQNLPEQAKRQMIAYPASKKWTLVHQDRLTELQGEQKRRQNARQTHGHDGPVPLLERADEEGSPEWYVKKVMDDTITSKQLASLSVSLRTQPIRYVFPRCFLPSSMLIGSNNVAGLERSLKHKAKSH